MVWGRKKNLTLTVRFESVEKPVDLELLLIYSGGICPPAAVETRELD